MFEDVKLLLEAGFTKDEIMKMLPKDEPETKPAPKPEPKPEPEQKPKQKPEEPARPENPEEKKPEAEAEPFDAKPFNKALDDMSASLNALNVKLQRMALSMYEQPEGKEKTVESIIARIVDPEA